MGRQLYKLTMGSRGKGGCGGIVGRQEAGGRTKIYSHEIIDVLGGL